MRHETALRQPQATWEAFPCNTSETVLLVSMALAPGLLLVAGQLPTHQAKKAKLALRNL